MIHLNPKQWNSCHHTYTYSEWTGNRAVVRTEYQKNSPCVYLCMYACMHVNVCVLFRKKIYKNTHNSVSMEQHFPIFQKRTIARLIGRLAVFYSKQIWTHPSCLCLFYLLPLPHLVSFSALGSVVNSDHETDAVLEISCQWWRFILIWTEHAVQNYTAERRCLTEGRKHPKKCY